MASMDRSFAFAVIVPVIFSSGCMVVESAANYDGAWMLAGIGDATVGPADNLPRFIIKDGLISGFDGCNQFGGQLDDPQSMRIGQRACAGDYVKLPLDLSDPASHLDAAVVDGDRLSLPARAGLPASVFVRQ